MIQILKSILKKVFKEYPGIKKYLVSDELWKDWGYIVTLNDGITSGRTINIFSIVLSKYWFQTAVDIYSQSVRWSKKKNFDIKVI